MAIEYLRGVLRITNLFIAIFILLYAYRFLIKTSKRSERRPWDYLFVASFIFLLYQIFSLVAFFSAYSLWILENETVGAMVEFMYSGLVLLAFVSQHDLIIKNPLILISRKKGHGKKYEEENDDED